MKARTQYYTGQRFGRLVLVELSRIDERHRKFFLCRCDCGQHKVIQASLMSSGNTKSCGCLQGEVKRAKRRPDNHSEVTAIILGYQRHALKRGFDFLLSRDHIDKIIRQDCKYCGSPPANFKTTKNSTAPFPYNGIDRVDPKKHYTVDNVVPCCSICNNAKSNLSLEVFAAWVQRLRAMAEQWG